MILLFDFSRVLLFPKDLSYSGSLNSLYREHKDEPGFTFFDYFRLNIELLEFLDTLRDSCSFYMFTSESIQNAPEIFPEIDKRFKKIYSALDIGFTKKDSEAYSYIAQDLGVVAAELLFVDDTQENIEAAQKAGLGTFLYKNNQEFIDYIRSTY
jgi:FMN phosphatase YigB (HAD superfamily)